MLYIIKKEIKILNFIIYKPKSYMRSNNIYTSYF